MINKKLLLRIILSALFFTAVLSLSSCQQDEMIQPTSPTSTPMPLAISGEWVVDSITQNGFNLNQSGDIYNFLNAGAGYKNEESFNYSTTLDSLYIDYIVGDRDNEYKVETLNDSSMVWSSLDLTYNLSVIK
tara:strand:- start:30168 stop:30563 length:396 start_codon:yes stop_codon:yes gene_type:complete